jgi:hypothetical protein
LGERLDLPAPAITEANGRAALPLGVEPDLLKGCMNSFISVIALRSRWHSTRRPRCLSRLNPPSEASVN